MDTLSYQVTAHPAYTQEALDLDLRWWAAANYLTVAQIYLQSNPLVRDELTVADIKPRLLGHWGTSPGLSMIYTLLNRLIRDTGSDCIYVTGPGHGGPALLANVYLEGTYSEVYPDISRDVAGPTPGAGQRRLCRSLRSSVAVSPCDFSPCDCRSTPS